VVVVVVAVVVAVRGRSISKAIIIIQDIVPQLILSVLHTTQCLHDAGEHVSSRLISFER
jgi:hypothetical protein